MRCLQCHRAFPPNDSIEALPYGDSLAYDPARGRLWIVCRACMRWSLVPLESRWEALEELEKRVRDGARLLARTENIALHEADGLRIVRVGRATRHEEAWWRYGRELATRYDRSQRVARRGEALELAAEIAGRVVAFALTGWPVWPSAGGATTENPWLERVRDRQFGARAWSGVARCACGAGLDELYWEDRAGWLIGAAQDGSGWRLSAPCPHCGREAGADGPPTLDGLEAGHVVRRILAYQNFAGASEKQIGYAARLIEHAGGPERAIAAVAQRHAPLGRLISTERLALEIAAHEARERELAALELAALEARWRDEEALAAIVDGELTPVPLLSRLFGRER